MKTNGELNYLAQKHGWKAETLTRARINRMPADESDWHSRFNADEFTRAWGEDQAKAENKKNTEAAKSQRIWKNEATNEETEESIREVQEFVAAYPQFRADFVPNREALISFLRSKTLSCVKANLVAAFEDLASKGFLLLNPSAIGIGEESEISGGRVVRHPELYKLLAPAPTEAQKAKLEQGKMSAAEWKEAHKEDFKPTQASPSFFRALEQAIATFRLSNPTYIPTEENQEKMETFLKANDLQMNPQGLQAAFSYLTSRGELELNKSGVIEGTVTRYTNLGGSQPGFPPKSDKYSFQKKISSLSSSEYLERINNDPEFRQAVNALG